MPQPISSAQCRPPLCAAHTEPLIVNQGLFSLLAHHLLFVLLVGLQACHFVILQFHQRSGTRSAACTACHALVFPF